MVISNLKCKYRLSCTLEIIMQMKFLISVVKMGQKGAKTEKNLKLSMKKWKKIIKMFMSHLNGFMYLREIEKKETNN